MGRPSEEYNTAPRRRFLRAAVAGLIMAGPTPSTALAATGQTGNATGQTGNATGVGASCAEDKGSIVDALLLAEHVAMTFYYTGLTTPAIVTPGPSARAPTRGGTLTHLSYVQATLAQEQRHAHLWHAAGAGTPYGAFYFPAATFTRPGYTSQETLFLGVLDYLETVLVGAYLAAVARLAVLGHTALAVMAVQILETECTHRVLGRAIAGDSPADNVTLEVDAFPCVGDATQALQPFITGRGFRGGATPAVALPANAQVARVLRRTFGR